MQSPGVREANRRVVLRINRRFETKKLEGAAEYWAGARVVDKTSEDLAALGAPPEIVKKAQKNKPDPNFYVFEENWDGVMIFLELSTQWNIAASGQRIGLNYPAVESLFRIKGIKERKKRFEEIQFMEFAAIKWESENRKDA